MFRFVLLAVAVTLVSIGTSFSPGTSSPVQAAEGSEIVSFRCVNWKTRHEHNAKQSDQIVETLKKLKCEVVRSKHNGHDDIKYRCPNWLNHSSKTHADAHKLEAWLKALKFETKHTH